MIPSQLKNGVMGYDRTQFYICRNPTCPNVGYIVHYLDAFGVIWMDDIGQSHNHCKLESLPKHETPTSTETRTFLRVRELGGTRHRLIQTRTGAEQAEARALANREREKIAWNDVPPWMLRPCPLSQIPNDCMLDLDKCQDAKFCFKQRLAEYVKRNKP